MAGLIIGPICLVVGVLVIGTVVSQRWRAWYLKHSSQRGSFNPVGAFGFGVVFLGFGLAALEVACKVQTLSKISGAIIFLGFLILILNSVLDPIVRRFAARWRAHTLSDPHFLFTNAVWWLFVLTMAVMLLERPSSTEQAALLRGTFWFLLITGILDGIVRVIRKPLKPETNYTLEIRARFKGKNAPARSEVEGFIRSLKDPLVAPGDEEAVFKFKDENGVEVLVIVDSKNDPDPNVVHEVMVMGSASRQMCKFSSQVAAHLGWEIHDSERSSWYTPGQLESSGLESMKKRAGIQGLPRKIIPLCLLVVLLMSFFSNRLFGLAGPKFFLTFALVPFLLYFSGGYVIEFSKLLLEQMSRPKGERAEIPGIIMVLLILGLFAFIFVVIVLAGVRALMPPK